MYYIVTDSSTDMPQSWVEAQHDFHIVSLSCTINGVSSVPGTSEVAKKETYRQLRSGVVIKTSAVNTATWEECFQKLLDEGQDVLCITSPADCPALMPPQRTRRRNLRRSTRIRKSS